MPRKPSGGLDITQEYPLKKMTASHSCFQLKLKPMILLGPCSVVFQDSPRFLRKNPPFALAAFATLVTSRSPLAIWRFPRREAARSVSANGAGRRFSFFTGLGGSPLGSELNKAWDSEWKQKPMSSHCETSCDFSCSVNFKRSARIQTHRS